MPCIDTIVLRCANPEKQMNFYTTVLGMTAVGDDIVGYGGVGESQLRFTPAETPYTPASNDLYSCLNFNISHRWTRSDGLQRVKLAIRK